MLIFLPMEYDFTYSIYDGDILLRVGKGYVTEKSEDAVRRYLRRRYGSEGWDSFGYSWHFSESAALKRETVIISEYVETYGELPPANYARGGGGRQRYTKCKVCNNDALSGNYGFCGIHRR
jgi:hypothetical protein